MNKYVLSKYTYFKEDSNLHSVRSKEKDNEIKETKKRTMKSKKVRPKNILQSMSPKNFFTFLFVFQIKG